MRYGKLPAMMFDSALLPFLNLHQTTAKMMEEARRENAPMLKHMQAGKSFGVFWGPAITQLKTAMSTNSLQMFTS